MIHLRNSQRYWAIVVLMMLVKLCLHLFTNTLYELHRDEMLYFNMADHPAFGYASVPPVIGWLAWISQSVFGYSVFGLRLFPALIGSVSVFIMARMVRDLGGGTYAILIAGTAYILSPGFLLFASLFTPNIFEQFLWLLFSYLFFRMTHFHQPRLWVWLGIIAGITFLTKYSMLFLAGSFIIALMLSPKRSLLLSRYFLAGLFCFAVIVFPNLLWQQSHGWPVIGHMEALKSTQLVNMNILSFFSELLSLLSLFTLVAILGLIFTLHKSKHTSARIMGMAVVIILLIFLLLNGKGYYFLGVIPILYVFGGLYPENCPAIQRHRLVPVLGAICLAIALCAIPFGLPLLSFEKLEKYHQSGGRYLHPPFYRWEDGKNHSLSQVYSDMTGWAELCRITHTAYRSLSPEERAKCTIFAEKNYGYAGAIHFYGKNYGLPEPVTFLESYTLWAPDRIPLGPILYINYDCPDVLLQHFLEVQIIGTVTDPYFREKGIKVFLCKGPGNEIADIYRRLALDEKGHYKQ